MTVLNVIITEAPGQKISSLIKDEIKSLVQKTVTCLHLPIFILTEVQSSRADFLALFGRICVGINQVAPIPALTSWAWL